MKYGLVCKVCDRLLWKGNDKPPKGQRLLPEQWVHAVTGERPLISSQIMWCHCKGDLKYVELQEPR